MEPYRPSHRPECQPDASYKVSSGDPRIYTLELAPEPRNFHAWELAPELPILHFALTRTNIYKEGNCPDEELSGYVKYQVL